MLRTVGKIIRPHGIRGELTVDIRTDEPEKRFREGAVLVADPSGDRLTIQSVRLHQGRLLIFFEEVPDRNAAEELRGVELCVDASQIEPPDDPEEFHDHQLIGLPVVLVSGESLGKLTRIDHGPAADMLWIRTPEGKNVLIPFVSAMVPEVDLAGGKIVVDPPEGLLDL